jgi:hypothetical protein
VRSHDLRSALTAAFLLLVLAGLGAPARARAQAPARPNLAHLDFLGDRVAPPTQAGHTTWRLDQEPSVGVLWTYAEPNADGSYRRIGGGSYNAATNTYAQGAFNTDDISRAAVVYLRHWRRHRDDHSRLAAYQLLRGLAYMQTVEGPNAGNMVLWMQPVGTLNLNPVPREEPHPSDSAESYWLARTVWALGAGYREFADVDRPFARFLRQRLDLAIAALDRQVLDRYGSYLVVDGRAVPAWLVVNGADATAEAMLGLAAYVDAGGGAKARRALGRFADGVARMGTGSPRDWPYGAVLPWALSPSLWHGWGAQMPAALADASVRLGRGDLLAPAIADAASFTPHLLVAGGPDNGWIPAPADRSQIAYGADSRIQSLLAVADASKRAGLRRLAGVAATWYFGNNAAGAAMYDQATGRTFDGVSGDGVVNLNSGAESTIHGLLSMIALEGAPDVASWSQVADPVERVTYRVAEAEDGVLSGGAEVVTPPEAWTGESGWSGGKYVSLPAGASVAFGPPALFDSLVEPIALRSEGSGGGSTRWTAGSRLLGSLSHENAGAQGASPASGVLEVSRLPHPLRQGERVSATASRGTASVDAALIQPLAERLVLGRGGAAQAVLRSFDDRTRSEQLDLPGIGVARVWSYDSAGRLVSRSVVSGPRVRARVLAGGFTIAER